MTRSIRARCFALALAGAAGTAAGTAAADKPAKPAPVKPAPTARPTAAQALTAAQAWIDALGEAPAKAAPLTASSLYVLANAETGPACAETTATKPDEIKKALGCLEEVAQGVTDLKPWKKGAEKGMGPLVKPLLAKLKVLERTSTVVYMHEKCVGEGRDVAIAVTLEKDQPRVSAVMSWKWVCGE